MEYIKKEDLIIGEVYTHENGNICRCDQITNKYIIGKHLGNDRNEFGQPPKNPGNFCIDQMRLATPEEKHWLNEAIRLDKFITFEEAMKTFIPEYVECVKLPLVKNLNFYSATILGKIYKVDNWNYLPTDCTLVDETNGSCAHHRFKPSTKEAYDAQFVVKEPKFVLPEKWCIKSNNQEELEKVLEFKPIDDCKDTVSLIYYRHFPILNNNCTCYPEIQKNYVEITFEQFKKYVLKEEIVEEKVIEPLPQFKIIETIETITKVENNEGSQFFIGDIVKSVSGIVQKIESFQYNRDNTQILAFTDYRSLTGIGINKLEHYIEPEFILPEKWAIKIDVICKEDICNWFQKNKQNNYNGSYLNIVRDGEYLHYPIYNSTTSHRGFDIEKIYPNYTKITFDQFKKYVLKKNN